METSHVYISFNATKSIEELQYHINQEIIKLEGLKLELRFYSALLEKPIFKDHVINLYERLEDFKNNMKVIDKNRTNLLGTIHAHANHIKNKIECDDVACDNFFIKEQDAIDLKIFKFHNALSDFKFKLFQYLESVLVNS